MVSDFGMTPLILMPLHSHSPFYFPHHNALNVELNIQHISFLSVPFRPLLSLNCKRSIPKASAQSYDQSQRRSVGKGSETNKSPSGPED